MKEPDGDLGMVVWRALCGEVGGMGAWKVTGVVKDFVGDAESRPSLLLGQTVGTNVHSFRTQAVTKTEARLVWAQSASVIHYTLSVLS